MTQNETVFELEGDTPTPLATPSITSSLNEKEKEALKPAPLNFSKPKNLNFSRPRPRVTLTDDSPDKHDEPPQSPAEYTAGPTWQIHQPYLDRRVTSETIPEEPELGEETDSFVEQGSEEEDSNNEEDEDDAAPPPVVRTTSRPQELSHHYNIHKPYVPPRSQASQGNVWIYKPYAESISSRMTSDDASSIFTTATEDATGDDASIAESADTSYTSASDFAFDGRMGWNPRNSLQAERERQGWASPDTQRTLGNGYNHSNGYHNSIERQASLTAANAPIPVDESSMPLSTRDRSVGSDLQRQTTAGSQGTHFSSADERPRYAKSNTSGSNSTTTTAPAIPLRAPRIVKRTSSDQQSLHMEPSGARETNRSNGGRTDSNGGSSSYNNGSNPALTMSSSNRSGSISSSEWSASEVDVSSLSPQKIAKLKKKGINPALYLEMKQARKPGGKKSWISPLTANTFLS